MAQATDLKKEVDLLQGSPYLHGLRRISELKNLSISALKSLQSQLKTDLEEIEKVITGYEFLINTRELQSAFR